MNRSQEKYTFALRIATVFVVAFLWYLSIIWSADGFSINDPDLQYIGIGLALSVTVSQLVFNRGVANPTIFVVGLAAYVYGFATNFIGISKVIGLSFTSNNFTENPFGFIISALGVTALAVIVEAAPESFLLWAIYPKERSPGDFISSLMKGMSLPKKNDHSPKTFRTNNVPKRSNFQNVSKRSQNVPSRSEDIPMRVLAYYERYKSQNGGKAPSYKKIVENVDGVNSTSQVKPILKQIGII